MATTTSTGGFPDATTTGVQAGVTLKPYNGDLVVNTPGTVINGLDIHGTVYINASNVTLVNCQITDSYYFQVKIAQNVTGVAVQNCTINGMGTGDGSNGIQGTGTFINNNIYNVENGIAVDGNGPTVIQDNYIHDLKASGSPHYDGIQIDGGLSNITIEHNTVINSYDQTSAIMIDNGFGPISNVKVDNNLLVGGGYTIYVDGQFNSDPISNVSITNNHMGTGHWGITDFNKTSPAYTGNVNDGGALAQTLNTTGQPPTTPPAAPQIVSFSNDSGTVGDHITNDNTLTLGGTAAANSTVSVFDGTGTTPIGTATADSSGHWTTLPTSVLSDGTHNLTATETDSSGHTSAPSAAFSLTIDTHAPGAPTMAAYSQAGAAVGQTTTLNDLVLKGIAEAGSTINVFDAGKQIGTATTNSAGAWSFDAGNLANGSHNFTSKAIDAAGNTSSASATLAETVTTPTTPTSAPTASIDFLNVRENYSHHSTIINGTADAYSQVKLYDGTTLLGSATANANGTWLFTTRPLSDTLHTIKAQEVDSAGHVIATSSGAVIVAGSHTSTLTGTGGNDYMISSTSNVNDTFVFAANFGHSTVEGFTVAGPGIDTIQFSKSEFDSFASVLSHASQVGHDVVISAGNDSLTMKNTKIGALNSHDFHFA